MFRVQQNFRNLKSIQTIDFISLQQRNQLLSRTASRSYNPRFLSSASYSTKKKINLPEINDEKLRDSILKPDSNYRFHRFYGDKAYNYYAVRALRLKLPNVDRSEFIRITDKLITREFLSEIAVVCELDKHTKSVGRLGEMMEAYCSGMLFNGMEEEMKKFASDVVDYYLAKTNKVVKLKKEKKNGNEKQKGAEMKNDKKKVNNKSTKKEKKPKKEKLLIKG